ncbi:MAG: ATP-binding protein, partial [Rhodospirillales bacterium]
APLDLAQGGRGFVIYIPYQQDGALQGFINIVFRADTLIASALPNEQRTLYDLHITDEGRTLYDRHTDNHLAEPNKKSFKVANRLWTAEIAPTVQLLNISTNHNATIFLFLGLFITVALPLMLSLIMRRHMQLRQSERRLADFADISSDWFWETDNQLRFSYFSARFEQVTGAPPSSLLGKTRQEAGAPDSDPVKYQIMLKNMDNRMPFRDFEHTRQKPDGTLAYLAISGRPVFDENDVFIGYRGIGRDISGRKKDQKTLTDALIASEQANRIKSEFLATMSHEFRTPLNAIIGFSEMIKEEYFGPLGSKTYKDYSNDIHNSGRHMLDLVNDILDFSAIEASKRPMHMEFFQLSGLLKDGVRSVEKQMQDKNLTIRLDVPADLPDMHADKRSVYQIILNLLTNAVKFTPPDGHITVKASVFRHDFTLEISDTGIGIAAEKLATITDPFSQSHTDPHIAGTGTGLGLMIVKSLVDAHGGKLHIESESGVGTLIRIVFPRSQEAPDQPDIKSDIPKAEP